MLNKTAFKASLKNIFEALKKYDGSDEQSQDDAIEKLADELSLIIDNYIRSATITSVPALVAPPGGGPVTGTITNTIS